MYLVLLFLCGFLRTHSWSLVILCVLAYCCYIAIQRVYLVKNNCLEIKSFFIHYLPYFNKCQKKRLRFEEIYPDLSIEFKNKQIPTVRNLPLPIVFVVQVTEFPLDASTSCLFPINHISFQIDTLPSLIFLRDLDPSDQMAPDAERAMAKFVTVHEWGHTTPIHAAFKNNIYLAAIQNVLVAVTCAILTQGNALVMTVPFSYLVLLYYRYSKKGPRETTMEALANRFAVEFMTPEELESIRKAYDFIISGLNVKVGKNGVKWLKADFDRECKRHVQSRRTQSAFDWNRYYCRAALLFATDRWYVFAMLFLTGWCGWNIHFVTLNAVLSVAAFMISLAGVMWITRDEDQMFELKRQLDEALGISELEIREWAGIEPTQS